MLMLTSLRIRRARRIRPDSAQLSDIRAMRGRVGLCSSTERGCSS
jgi:hypothetical protein